MSISKLTELPSKTKTSRATDWAIAKEQIETVADFIVPDEQVSGDARSRRLRRNHLVRWEILAICGAAAVSFVGYSTALSLFNWRHSFHAMEALTRTNFIAMFLVPLVTIIVGSYAKGHYTRFKPFWTEFAELVKTTAIAIAIGALLLYAFDEHFSRLWFFTFWALVLALVPMTRLASRCVLKRRNEWYRPGLMIGAGDNARAARIALESDSFVGTRIVCIVDPQVWNRDDVEILAEVTRVVSMLETMYGGFDLVFAPKDNFEDECFTKLLDGPLAHTHSVTISPPVKGLPLYGATATSVLSHDTIFFALNTGRRTGWQAFVKRGFDVCASLFLLTLLSPVFLFIAFVLSRDGGTVFYASQRVGLQGKLFPCLKFRTMVPHADTVLEHYLASNEHSREEWRRFFKLSNDPRITRFGSFLRRRSLDELPQLINVLIGEMSLVGPRPILPEEANSYGSQFKLYTFTRPGMTGLWQVSGRSTLSQERRVQLNAWYARNWSLWIDMVIVLKTIPVIVHGNDAS